MQYRTALPSDIPIMAALRKQQLVDEGIAPDQDIDQELTEFFQKKLADGSMVEWLGIEDGTVVATAAIVFYEFPPSYTNKSGVKGYVANMYTAPSHRGRGIAPFLLDRLVEEAKKRKVKTLWLGASKMGRPVYLKYGFQETDQWLELNVSAHRPAAGANPSRS